MKKTSCLAVAVLFLGVIFAAPGGEFWEKKEYRQWSEKECGKILENSPWAKQLKLTQVLVMPSATAEAASTTSVEQPFIKYTVQFRSALPVRQAVVRQMQIARKYDSLPPQQKQEFDKSAEAFLSADMAGAIVVNVRYETNSQPNELELARYWQSQTTDLLKNTVYLILSRGDKVPVTRYAASQGGQHEFQFLFPRQVDGKPVVGPEDKSIKLEFPYPIIGQMGDGRCFMEFKTEKMMLAGNLVY